MQRLSLLIRIQNPRSHKCNLRMLEPCTVPSEESPCLCFGVASLRTRRCHLGGSFHQANSVSVSGNCGNWRNSRSVSEGSPALWLHPSPDSCLWLKYLCTSSEGTNGTLYHTPAEHGTGQAFQLGTEMRIFPFYLLFTSLNLFIITTSFM